MQKVHKITLGSLKTRKSAKNYKRVLRILKNTKKCFNPNQTKGGYKVPEAFSNVYHFIYDEVWMINPSCKFLFWC